MKKLAYLFTILFILTSCNNNGSTSANTQTISIERANPKPEPVATFSEDVTSETGKLNNWKFAVALYETHKTFMYRVQMQYGEVIITDSLQLPNLGIPPKPALQKGKEAYSCIIGFMDDKNVFRDYKQVIVTDGNIRIHTLKYYSVQPAAGQ